MCVAALLKGAVGLFERSPFLLMVVVNVLPLPIDVVRWLAISHRYGRLPYAVSTFLGRWIRYAVILLAGWGLNLPLWAIVLVMVVLGVLPLAWRWGVGGDGNDA